MLDIENIKNKLLDYYGENEEEIDTDGSGLSPGQISRYYQTRTRRIYQR